MRRGKRLVLIFISMLILTALMACNDVYITDTTPDVDNHFTLQDKSIRPPLTKYLITTSKKPVGYTDGEVYLTDSYSRGGTLKIEEYWIKENDYWVYHKETKEFPLNVRLKSYPSGGEFGVDIPNHDFKCYIHMPDDTYYLIRNRNEIIPVTSDIIRIHHYFVRETPEGRWYYHEEPKDLPKNDARIN